MRTHDQDASDRAPSGTASDGTLEVLVTLIPDIAGQHHADLVVLDRWEDSDYPWTFDRHTYQAQTCPRCGHASSTWGWCASCGRHFYDLNG